MFKFTLKILTVFALFFTVSCAMNDEDEDSTSTQRAEDGYYSGNYTDFLVSSKLMLKSIETPYFDPGNTENGKLISDDSAKISDPEINFNSLDTARTFPNDTTFHKGVMNCIVNSYDMCFRIVNSIFNPRLKKESWMKFTEPYLGTYTSPLDSRIKQWEVVEKASYAGVDYQYCLKITDIPGSSVSKDKDKTPEKEQSSDNAVEFFYNENFQNGVVVFSPVNYDRVKYPEHIFSKDMKCLLKFSTTKESTVNELFITGYSPETKTVYRIDNIYLQFSELKESGYIRFSGLIDMPRLWFDAAANAGYCICIAGTVDNNNACTVCYTGLVRNSSAETEVSKLISENSSGTVLGRLYPSWWKMTTGENGAKDTAVFKNPAYYISSLYMGYGKTDNAVYQKAVNNTIEVLGGKINISPYQNSINKVLW
ncbi:MAG: hypothetical protein II956_11525 [Bacteroidales bacterium]|nr:hypothetical protein [Bacteroidales bacterium]